jgi:hypothetical protein
LKNSQYGLFAMMLLFLIPEVGIGLAAIADFVINFLT